MYCVFLMASQKIAFVQPHIPAGKSLGIEKSPTSIQALAGQLERDGHEVRMFHEPVGDLMEKLISFHPDVVGISTMTANFPEGRAVADAVKRFRDDIFVVLGGWHASGCAREYLAGHETETLSEILNPQSSFDCIVVGEGELVMSELVQKISSGVDFRDVTGIGFYDLEGIHITTAERIKDLDTLADPSWRGLPIENYRDQRSGALDLSCHFHRACRFDCSFCATSAVYGRGVRSFSPQRAIDQIQSLLEQFHPQVITFTDEDFFASPPWVRRLVELLEERDFHGQYGVEFDVFSTLNDLHRFESSETGGAFLDRMKKVGFGSFTVGVESLNPRILRGYNKELMILPTMTNDQRAKYRVSSVEIQNEMLVSHYFDCVQRAITFAQSHGIFVVGDYILGNLGETADEVRAGFEKFSRLRGLHVAYLPIFTPFPGTGLWREAYNSGKIARDASGKIDWSKFDASAGALDLGYDVAALRNELEIQFYTSSRYHVDMLAAITRDSSLARFFESRFQYLNRLFPENPLVVQRLRELSDISQDVKSR